MVSAKYFLLLTGFTLCIGLSESVLPAYLPCATICNPCGRTEDLIRDYFYLGFSYGEIITFLMAWHNTTMGYSTLKRILRRLGLRRRPIGQNISSVDDIIVAILKELESSGSCLGYRALWRRLVIDNRLRIPRDNVLRILRVIDPDGVERRKARKLKRRKYVCPAPNFVWHIDGYDKLKPFGFAIHGCIDGFSRRIIWLEVAVSNNDPRSINTYYLEALEQLGAVPFRLRCDCGTENSKLRLLHSFFHYDAFNTASWINNFIYGESTSNQRIEAWWGILRRQGGQWWINLFKDMRSRNLFHDANPLHRECLKFCFMGVIQMELNKIARHWNLHLICPMESLMYFSSRQSYIYEAGNHGKAVDRADVLACLELYGTTRHHQTCLSEFKDIVHILKPNLRLPETAEKALDLYIEISTTLNDF